MALFPSNGTHGAFLTLFTYENSLYPYWLTFNYTKTIIGKANAIQVCMMNFRPKTSILTP